MKRIQQLIVLLAVLAGGNAHAQVWKNYADSAKIFMDQRKNTEAINYLIKAKDEIGKDSVMTNTYAGFCNTLGILYRNTQQPDKAESYFLIAMDIREKLLGTNHLDYAVTCTGLGILYITTGKYVKAANLIEQARNIRSKTLGANNAEYARCCFLLAICYSYTGKLNQSESLYIESKQIREKTVGKWTQDYAASCNSLAILYATTGEFAKADPLFLEAKEVMGKVLGKQHPEYISVCSNLAALYGKKGQYYRAESQNLELLDIREIILGKDHDEYAASCFNLGSLYREMGVMDKAEKFFMLAKQVWEKNHGKEFINYANSCNSLSVLYADMGNVEKAILWGSEAKELRKKLLGVENLDYAQSCNNLAVLYKETGDYKNAESLAKEANNLYIQLIGKENIEYAESCNNLATIFLEKGDNTAAEYYLKESRQMLELSVGKMHPEYASSCNNLGFFYKQSGQYDKAKSLLEEAARVRINSLGKEHYMLAETFYNLAGLHANMQQPDSAMSYYVKAFEIQKYNQEKVFLFTSETEKEYYLKQASYLQSSFFSYLKKYNSSPAMAYDLVVSNKNLILSSATQLHHQFFYSNDTITSGIYNEWTDLKEQLAFWYSKPLKERPAYVKELDDRAQQLEKELVRKTGSVNRNNTKNAWKILQQSLQPNEAAIEFISFQYQDEKRWTDSIYYAAIIIKNEYTEPKLVFLFEQKSLDSLLVNKGIGYGRPRINAIYSASVSGKRTLYDVIWKPLQDQLEGVSKIFFAPAGSLYKLSFASLPLKKAEVLSDKFELVQVNTTAVTAGDSQTHIDTSVSIRLYGGILYDADSLTMKTVAVRHTRNNQGNRNTPAMLRQTNAPGFNYLPGTEKEVDGISQLARKHYYPIVLSVGNEATEESFKDLSGNNSPVVLHIASHGFFFQDPSGKIKDQVPGSSVAFKESANPLIRSGLALAGANNAWRGQNVSNVEDGILTSYEVSNMYLPNTKLAVLSACETGLGDVQGNEGVYGLQRSFKIAGVENLIMSLWKVPDQETAEFMQLFYKNLFSDQKIQNAFKSAQAAMRNKYRNDPYKWAAWVLIR